MKIRICPNCGTHNGIDSWNCSACGETLALNSIADINEKIELNPKQNVASKLEGSMHEQPLSDEKTETLSYSSQIRPSNNRVESGLTGLLTGFITSVVLWMFFYMMNLDDSFIRSILTDPLYGDYGLNSCCRSPYIVLNIVIPFLVIGALYGGISKRGGTGAINGAVIGILYGVADQLLKLFSWSIMAITSTDAIVSSLVPRVLFFGFIGMIVGLNMKLIFGSDQIRASRSDLSEVSKPSEVLDKFSLSGLRTGIGINVVLWIMSFFGGLSSQSQLSNFIPFLAFLLLFSMIGSFYGGISKKGGAGAINGMVIGMLSGIVFLLYWVFLLVQRELLDERTIGAQFVGYLGMQILLFAIYGTIVGVIMKFIFGSDQR